MSNAWEAAEMDYAEYFLRAFQIQTKVESGERHLFKRKHKPKIIVLDYDPRIRESIRRRNRFGITPVHTAAFYGSKTVLRIFLQCDSRTSVLPIIRYKENPLEHRSTSTRSVEWQYPLQLAILGKSKGAVKMLLEYGADPFLRDSTGQNAWDVAKATMNRKSWHLLEKWCLANKPPHSLYTMPPQHKRRAASMEDLTGDMVTPIMFHSMSNSMSNVREKEVIPRGPWDLEGCFIQAACGACPEAFTQQPSEGDDSSSSSGSTIQTS